MARNESKNDLRGQLAFYEGLLKRTSKDLELLKVMGDLYMKVGDHDKGLQIDKRLARITPKDPLVHYNLACSYAILRDTNRALKSLKKAIELGYDDPEWMQCDPDLKNLREIDGFKRLINDFSSLIKGMG